jgi:glycosyltransferase involved in cell wall biosynthesis
VGINKKKINLLYDASLLTYLFEKGSMNRAGIFFSAYNILKELEKQRIYNITLLLCSRYEFLHKMKNDPYFSKFSYVKFYDKQNISNRIELIKSNKKNIKSTANIFKKTLYIMKIFKHSLYAFYYFFSNNIYSNNKVIKRTNVFFSPVDSIHPEIIKHTHIRKYILLHDTMPLLFPEYYPTFFLTNDHITEYAHIRSINKENYYFCNSECTKRDYLKYYSNQLDESKITVTYIASSQFFFPDYDKNKLTAVFDKYKVNYRNNDKYIFSLCTLEPRKNLIFTVKCFIKFIKKHNIDNLYIYLGGTKWDKYINLLEEQINDMGKYCDKIIRLGYIDDEDVNILYSNSLFFTYISQYEGFGIPPLEAMQAGTPVITSNNSSLPEVVGDAAIMIDYNNEEQCIKAFEDLFFNEDLRKYYIKKGLERVKLFSWEKTVKKMSDVILRTAKYL